MIRFLNAETVGGHRYGKGAIASFDTATEETLIAQGDAEIAKLPGLVAQSFSPVTRTSNTSTDTAFVVLASATLPGGTMGLDSKLVVVTDWDFLAAATKILTVDFGGTGVFEPWISGTPVSLKGLAEIQNMHSLSSQKTFNGSSYQTQTVARLASSVDTSEDVAIDIKCRWSANQADSLQTITLIGYSVWHYPGD